MEHESHPHHHPHGTGFRWLDITLALAATFVSLISLWLAIHSSHSMEKLVAANSYPYLELWQNMGTGKLVPGTDRPQRRVEYQFSNSGVGPARIEWVQLFFKKKPVTDINDLLAACCAGSAKDAGNLDMRGNVVGHLVRPGATLSMFAWDEAATANPVFDALHRQMDEVKIDYCYCSVFDECYVRHDNERKPTPVKACVAPAKTFRPAIRAES